MGATEKQVIKTTFQLKRGTAEAWTEKNPTLAAGEPGFEVDTKKLKIGDGKQKWEDLPYFMNENSYSETVLIPAQGNTPAFTQADFIASIIEADDGTALIKKNGALSWTKPVTEEDLATIIAESNQVQTIVNNFVAEHTQVHFRGEASNAVDDLEHDIYKTILYDDNGNEIPEVAGDVYLYQGIEYVYDPEVEAWLPLADSSYDGDNDFVTHDEFRSLQDIIRTIEINAGEPVIATNSSIGNVKGDANGINKISIESNGTMTVNAISVDKLVNASDSELILKGGSSLSTTN